MNKSILLGISTVFVLFALSTITSNVVFADVISPLKQLELDFTPKEIICKENLVKIIRISNNQAACVSPDSVELLVEKGFAIAPNLDIVLEVKEQQSKPVGTITHMITTKQFKNPGEVETFPKISTYNYVFKICAIDNKIKSPEVIITSDSETKSVKLRDVVVGSCYTTASQIKASDPNSISSRLLNHGGITEAITELENKITTLKSDITEQRAKLSPINEELSSNDRAKKVSAIHKKITDIRNELKNVRAELQKYLLFLSLSSNPDISSISKGKSITGVNVEGTVSEIISVNLALIQPEDLPENSVAYNIVFEICAGETALRIPVAQLSSDIATKTVQMAEKIIANSCQVTTGKISAIDANSISISVVGQTESSNTIVDLEKRITEIKDLMTIEQEKLNFALTSSALSKEEKQATISESTLNITELRKELNTTKVELHKILLQVYR